jgi:uncharacterized protein
MLKKNFKTLFTGLVVIISVLILSGVYKARYSAKDSIQVTGIGSKDFKSDLIVWEGTFTARATELKLANAQIDEHRELVRNQLTKNGVNPDEIQFSSVDINRDYNSGYDERGKYFSHFQGFILTQRVSIESAEVDKIERVSREVTELINYGLEFYSSPPSYYYTQLNELKREMIAAATEDARTRAELIAGNANAKLGKLKNATMGVFQIIGQHSNEDFSWGGSFNTSSKMKTATITIRLEFATR